MQAFANFILRGRLQASLVVALAALLSFTGILSPLSLLSGAALALVTLRQGAVAGLIIMAYSAVALLVVSLGLFNDLRVLTMVILSYWLPVLIMAELLRRMASLSWVITLSGALVIAYIALVYLVSGDPAPAWREQLTALFQAVASQAQLGEAEVQQIIDMLAPMMTGLQALSELAFALIALFIARWWQAMLFNPGGFRQEFHNLRLQRWFAWPAVLILLGMMLSSADGSLLGQFASELGLVVMSLFWLQGLSVAHGLVGLSNAKVGWLIALYVLMIIPQFMMLMVLVGMIDGWLDIRARVARSRAQ
ncbi:MAG: DUF2232 domain-containing protein [Gammaproteobacteria bacterium]|nr:DUF2232 domain-containing protein [Gammaproteobacteria bacterium]